MAPTKIPMDSYTVLEMGSERVFFKPLTYEEFQGVVKANVLYHILTEKERDLPQAAQVAMLKSRLDGSARLVSSGAFEAIVRWMVKNDKLTLEQSAVLAWKRMFDEQGIRYAPPRKRNDNVELAVRIICLGIMPPTLPPQGGNLLGEQNPYREAFINMLRKEAGVEDETGTLTT